MMSADPNRLETLVSVPGEMEAAVIANLLQEHGISAKAVGGYTSGFKAEAPGEASVLVGQADLARAKELLAEIRAELRQIDWSTVDFGSDRPARDREDRPSDTPAEGNGERSGTPSGLDRRRLQFTLAGLLALQTSICVLMGLWKGLGAAAFSLLFLPTATLILLALGTAGIASDLDRARRIWRYVGRLLLIGLIAFAVLV
ncbi:MAG: putative signal transducing protein, partial [Planctomycetota bacterium]